MHEICKQNVGVQVSPIRRRNIPSALTATHVQELSTNRTLLISTFEKFSPFISSKLNFYNLDRKFAPTSNILEISAAANAYQGNSSVINTLTSVELSICLLA